MQTDKSGIILDYYDGAYGPTLRIDVQSLRDLAQIQKIFERLASSKTHVINLAQMDCVAAHGFDSLVLRSLDTVARQQKKSLTRAEGKSGGHIFTWSLPARGWRELLDLVNALVDGGGPGHQYLTEEGVDDAIVELAFME